MTSPNLYPKANSNPSSTEVSMPATMQSQAPMQGQGQGQGQDQDQDQVDAVAAQPTLEGVDAAPPALTQGRVDGPSEFSAVIRLAFATAAAQGWREIIISDANFASWPLGERAVAQSLNDWAKTGRTLTILARDYNELSRRHARFVTWRRTWSHIVVCRANTSVAEDDFPSVFWSPVWCMQRLDLVRSTAVSDFGPARRVAIRERLAECLRRSSPAFPANTLGL